MTDIYSAKFPHCDARVLHAPGECEHCDHYPELQRVRVAERVNFTGHSDPYLKPCPAVEARGIANVEGWGGNRRKTTCTCGSNVDPDCPVKHCIKCGREELMFGCAMCMADDVIRHGGE